MWEMIGDVIYKNHIYFLKHPGHLLNFWTLRVATGVDLQIFLRMGCIKESYSWFMPEWIKRANAQNINAK